jgi:hypothetical protein
LIVTVLPSGTNPPDIDGVESLVRLSEFDVPVSEAATKSGAAGADGATVSSVMFNGVDDGETFPAGSVLVVLIAHEPSVIVGKSQLFTDADFT